MADAPMLVLAETLLSTPPRAAVVAALGAIEEALRLLNWRMERPPRPEEEAVRVRQLEGLAQAIAAARKVELPGDETRHLAEAARDVTELVLHTEEAAVVPAQEPRTPMPEDLIRQELARMSAELLRVERTGRALGQGLASVEGILARARGAHVDIPDEVDDVLVPLASRFRAVNSALAVLNVELSVISAALAKVRRA